jgi:adenylate kinase
MSSVENFGVTIDLIFILTDITQSIAKENKLDSQEKREMEEKINLTPMQQMARCSILWKVSF